METAELRSKDEIKREIEESRRDVKVALQETRTTWKGRNAAARAWRATKQAAGKTKRTVTTKAKATDCAIRDNIYSAIGAAVGLGAVAGLIVRSRIKARRGRC